MRLFGTLEKKPRATRGSLFLGVGSVLRKGRTIRVVAVGDSRDYGDWLTVSIDTRDGLSENECAEAFAKRITRVGAALMTR
jgi:hypothetical protein